MVRYEDLRARPAADAAPDHRADRREFSDAEIEEAVEFGSFDNLRALETKGFFRQGGLALRNPNDPETFKVRRAKVGGYRDYFTPEQVAELEALMAERLSPAFGYAPADQTEPVAARGVSAPCAARCMPCEPASGRSEARQDGAPAAHLAGARRQARRQRPGRDDR